MHYSSWVRCTRFLFTPGWLAVVFTLMVPNAIGKGQQFGETTQLFPQFATGGGWTTSIAVHNPTLNRNS